MNASDPAAWGGDGADSGDDAATSGTTVATESPQDQDRREADALLWLRSVWGTFPPFGYLHGSLRTPGEPWTSTPPMRPGSGPLREVTDPAEALAVVARSWVAASQGADTYVCPYPHALMGRRAGRAVVRRVVHADIDSGPTDMGAVAELGALVVASGSVLPDGRHRTHVYVRLSEPVNAASHGQLCAALGAYVGGDGADTSKTGDQDVLRLPGTLNHKTTPPRPVEWLVRPADGGAGEPWEPAALAAQLGTELVADPEPEPDPPGAVRLSDGVLVLPDDDETAEPPPTPQRTPSEETGHSARRIDGLVRSVTDAPPEEGNHRLNWAAGKAAAVCATEPDAPPAADVRAALVDAYLDRPVRTRGESTATRRAEAEATVASGWAYGMAHPARALGDDETRKGPSVHAEPDDSAEPDGEHAEPGTAGGLLEIAPDVKVDGDREAWFWGSRDSLGRVRRFAQARRASPWATLGVVLARVLAATDYGTVLPPLVGGDGSLNLFCALVGRTSGGKGAAGNAGRDVLRVDTGHGEGDPFDTVQPGSGEGIAHVFAYREKRRGRPSRVVRHAWSVVLDARESESMAAILQRNGGGTLAAELCKAFMGEHLGHATVDPTRNVPVDAHTYRLAFLMGVQPALAGWLTALTAGGLPGRFLWLPTLDAQRPAREDRPSEPSPILWRAPDGGRRQVLQVPPEVVRAVEDHEDGKVAGTVAEIDGHRVFIREKVAAALARLDDPEAEAVDPESWELAGHVLDVSDATRAWLLATLAAERRTANVERGRAEGERSAVAAEAQASATEARVSRRVLALVREAGAGGTARGALRKRLRSTDRAAFDPALDGLVRAGLVRVEARAGQGQGTEWVTAL